MRLFGEVLAALLIGAVVLAIVGFGPESPSRALSPNSLPPVLGPGPVHRALGELRCEGRGSVIINVDGRDYAVNGMASPRYPPIQSVWSKDSHPETDIDRLIVQGLTLCAW